MAKKGAREIVAMQCVVCKNQNYVTLRNKVNMQNATAKAGTSRAGGGKLLLSKYCKVCKKHTEHKEIAKLK
jgi:ribosomal protein L33